MSSTIPSGSLYAATLELLRKRAKSHTLTMIADDTGVTLAWLSLLSKGKIPDPGVNRVQRIYEYLSGRTLEF